MASEEPAVERLGVSAFTVPTSSPEADGTLAWNETTIVIVTAEGGGRTGPGYTYANLATAALIADTLAGVVVNRSAFAVQANWMAMVRAIRNLGRAGCRILSR